MKNLRDPSFHHRGLDFDSPSMLSLSLLFFCTLQLIPENNQMAWSLRQTRGDFSARVVVLTATLSRWDDWVPQDRLRKFTEENHELARNLKKEMDAQRRAAPKPASTSTRRRPFGSDLNPASSTRGSEERGSIATAPPPPSRGTKRGREYEGIDKVCDFPAPRDLLCPSPGNSQNTGCLNPSSRSSLYS